MQIVVLADEVQKEAVLKDTLDSAKTVWVTAADEFLAYKRADVFIDLQFINTDSRKALLKQSGPKLVIIHSVLNTLDETDPSFLRINAWTTFLSSAVLEASSGNDASRPTAERVFSSFNKKLEWCKDDVGFIRARVVSMIINEAYLALDEGVSTREEINTAMKLGTAYPYGPFEWAEKIGLKSIAELLQKLSQTQARYTPARLLMQDASLTPDS